jgi:hypothetical protein
MEQYISLISGFVGALIGALASIATVTIQANYQMKRERTKDAVNLAVEEWKLQTALAKERHGTSLIPPLSSYVHYHTSFVKLAESGRLTPENLIKLHSAHKEISDVYMDEYRAQTNTVSKS